MIAAIITAMRRPLLSPRARRLRRSATMLGWLAAFSIDRCRISEARWVGSHRRGEAGLGIEGRLRATGSDAVAVPRSIGRGIEADAVVSPSVSNCEVSNASLSRW